MSMKHRSWRVLLAQISPFLHCASVLQSDQSSRASIPFLMCRVQVGPFTFTVVFVIHSTSLKGTLRTLRSASFMLVGSDVKNCRNRGIYGSRSLDWRTGFFEVIESNSIVGADPLLTPSRRRTPGVRMPS